MKFNGLVSGDLPMLTPKPQRYDLVTNYRCGTSIEEMEKSDDGEWVRFEDMNQWQHIETAPKDGTDILGWDGRNMTTVRWYQGMRSGWWTLVQTGEFASDGEWTPTHWMPLPDPPVRPEGR